MRCTEAALLLSLEFRNTSNFIFRNTWIFTFRNMVPLGSRLHWIPSGPGYSNLVDLEQQTGGRQPFISIFIRFLSFKPDKLE
jgi:hypothetical protein